MNSVEFFTSFFAAVFGFAVARQILKKRRTPRKGWLSNIQLPRYAESVIVVCLAMLASFALIEDLSVILGSDSSGDLGKSIGSKYGLVLGIAVTGLVFGHLDQKKGVERSSEDEA